MLLLVAEAPRGTSDYGEGRMTEGLAILLALVWVGALCVLWLRQEARIKLAQEMWRARADKIAMLCGGRAEHRDV
jgi:hypothetical protein